MATKILTFPFSQGQDEDTTKQVLPMGKMLVATNVRQRRNSAMGQRPDYAAASMTDFSGNGADLYDIYNLNGRLVGLGDNNDTLYATDVYEYVQATQGSWRGTSGATFNFRLPPATKVRNIGQPPDGVSSVVTAKCAATNNRVCMVYSTFGSVGGLTSYAIVIDPDTDATLFFSSFPLTNAKVVACGTSFWLLGVDSASDLVGYRIQTNVTTTLPSPTTLYTGTVTSQIYDACTVTNTTGTFTEFATFVRQGATTVIRRFNEAGTQQTTFAGPAVSADSLAIDADSSHNTIFVVTRVGAADFNATTYNLATNALTVGPTAVFGDAMTGDVSLARTDLGASVIDIAAEDSSRVVKVVNYIINAHSGSVRQIHNVALGGRGCIGEGDVTMLPLLGATDNLMMLSVAAIDTFIPMISTDVGIAADSPSLSHPESPGQVVKDFASQKLYWCRLVEGTDGQVIPIMSEFLYGSTARRQSCQIGNELFISGGVPTIYDGRQLVENCFLGRPTFSGSITSTFGGSLIPGATYDYCAVWKWTDSQNLLVQSAVSETVTHTLGSTNTATTMDVFTPHTLRRDSLTGSTATVALYRTIADGTSTSGTVISARDFAIDPAAAGDFSAKTLTISVDGGGNQTTTFGAGDNTVVELVAAINTQTTGCTASIEGNSYKIVSDTTGPTSSVTIVSGNTVDVAGTAPDSGFFSGQAGFGATTFTRGTVFHLTQVFYVSLTNPLGASLTIFDDTPDTDLPEQPVLYTQGERGALSGILEHNPAQPCEFCWPVGNRVFIGGLPNRSEVRISKALFPAECLAFSDDFAFSSFVDGDVTAVGSLDGTPIAFTRDEVFAFSNQLPDDGGNGSSSNALGALGEPIRIPSEGGCINPFSLVEVSFGLFYQSRDNKIMLLPRGGGSPVWAGAPIQDTLELFPNVTGACYTDSDHSILWTCRNVALNASAIIVLDIKSGQWSVDTVTSLSARSITDYNGRAAILDTNTVRLGSSSLTPSSFITYQLTSGSHQPFSGNGWGKLVSVTVSAEFRGNCRLQLRVSYDDGVTWTTMTKVFSYTTVGGFTAGQTVTAQWFPARRKCSNYTLDFQVLDQGGAATAGLNLFEYTVELEGSFPQKIRTATAQRG